MSAVVTENPYLYATTRRSYFQIDSRLKDLKSTDYYGFESSMLLAFLPWTYASAHVKPAPDGARTAQASAWIAAYPLSNAAPLEMLKQYLPVAWKAANDDRGLAVMRGLAYARSLLWLAGYSDKFLKHFKTWAFYGKPEFILCSHLVGFDWRAADNKRWSMGPGKVLTSYQYAEALRTTLEIVNNYQPYQLE